MSALLILSATTLTAQQAARLGSRQTMRPLPKELVKDGSSYMVLVDCDESGTDYNAGLYDSFGPEGVKYSFDLPDIQFVSYYYEKLNGETKDTIIFEYYSIDYAYAYIPDTISSISELEVYLNPNWIYLSEYPSIEGYSAFSFSPVMFDNYSYYFWNYEEYGTQYPTIYFVIDGDGHIWLYRVEYSSEENVVQMSVIVKEEANEEYIFSTIQDLELYVNLSSFKTGDESRYKTIVKEFYLPTGEKAYYAVRDYFKEYCELHDLYYNEYYARNFYNEYIWQYEKFGTRYPYYFFMIDDEGHLVVYNANYRIERDYSNATWEIDPDYGNGSSYQPNVGQFIYLNVDKSFYPTTPIFISQNLFNDDDNWEFLSLDIQFTPSDTSDIFRYYDDGVEIERRRISMKTVVEGIKIMNNEGTQLGYLPVQNKSDEYTTDIDLKYVSVLNGLVYIQTEEKAITNKHGYETEKHYEGIYAIDPKDASVHAITRSLSRMNLNSTVIDQGERLDIQISESGKNDNLTISSMSGQVINSSPVKEDKSISVNTGAMPKGIYNVTLRGNGNPTENQRIIIK